MIGLDELDDFFEAEGVVGVHIRLLENDLGPFLKGAVLWELVRAESIEAHHDGLENKDHLVDCDRSRPIQVENHENQPDFL